MKSLLFLFTILWLCCTLNANGSSSNYPCPQKCCPSGLHCNVILGCPMQGQVSVFGCGCCSSHCAILSESGQHCSQFSSCNEMSNYPQYVCDDGSNCIKGICLKV